MAAGLPAVGVGLPIVGPHAGPEAIETVALAAERLGYSCVSLAERLLLPAGEGWSNDYGLPEWPAYDSVETLTWVAARTGRIGLRTDVIVPLFQQPIVLARRLATLDHLSGGGRIRVGVALGWLPEEFDATGVPAANRAARFEDCLAALRACWGPDPVEHRGPYYGIPPARIGPKPLGPIPVAIGGLARPAVERAARLGDGFTLGFRNWDDSIAQIRWYRDAGGTGPVVARGGPMLADAEHATPPTTWTEPSIADDLARAAEVGIDEFVWDLNIVGYEPARQVEALEALAARIGLTP